MLSPVEAVPLAHSPFYPTKCDFQLVESTKNPYLLAIASQHQSQLTLADDRNSAKSNYQERYRGERHPVNGYRTIQAISVPAA